MTTSESPYTGESNGNGRVAFLMEWIWRVATVIVVPVVVYMLVQLASIQATVADINARVLVLEQRTIQLPPMDYRNYIDEKFLAVQRQITANSLLLSANAEMLNEIATDVKAHIRNMETLR